MTTKSGKKIVLLGTGGTIAGVAPSLLDNIGYTAAEIGVAALVDALPAALPFDVVAEQVAQLDSKDMGFEVWHLLARRCLHYLLQSDVLGVVVTHGTDTLEETAYFLHAVLSAAEVPAKPVIVTGAMRPASALAPDGPQNMLDSLAVAATPGLSGVMVVFAGTVHGAVDVQKAHPYRLDAFDSGDAGPLGYVEEGAFRMLRNCCWGTTVPKPGAPGLVAGAMAATELAAPSPSRPWPRVEIIMNYAGAGALMVDSLLSHRAAPDDPIRGIVVAATGNGSLHRGLEAGLLRAQAMGIQVVRATRCRWGRVMTKPGDVIPDSEGLSPVKARIAMILRLMRSAEGQPVAAEQSSVRP